MRAVKGFVLFTLSYDYLHQMNSTIVMRFLLDSDIVLRS